MVGVNLFTRTGTSLNNKMHLNIIYETGETGSLGR